jgi:hypothetical protein
VAFAGDIYRWIVEQGNVQCGDRPTSEVADEALAGNSESIDSSKDQARDEEKQDANESPEATPEELRAHALELEEKCVTYKSHLRKLLTSRDSYREDESGERVYPEEDEILAARESAQNQVEEHCSI